MPALKAKPFEEAEELVKVKKTRTRHSGGTHTRAHARNAGVGHARVVPRGVQGHEVAQPRAIAHLRLRAQGNLPYVATARVPPAVARMVGACVNVRCVCVCV